MIICSKLKKIFFDFYCSAIILKVYLRDLFRFIVCLLRSNKLFRIFCTKHVNHLLRFGATICLQVQLQLIDSIFSKDTI